MRIRGGSGGIRGEKSGAERANGDRERGRALALPGKVHARRRTGRGLRYGTGLFGDRAYAVVEAESGQVRSAKRAGWERLFEFRANPAGEPGDGPPDLCITLPEGSVATGEAQDRDERFSRAFGRRVELVSGDAFFDLGAVHLFTTASLEKLGELYPEGRFDPRRFRPNLVLEPDPGEVGFVGDGWAG